MNAQPKLIPVLAAQPEPIPALSFVIPAFNEEDNIAETIQRIDDAARKLVQTHEIVIVDDGSSDRTFEAVKDIASNAPLKVLRRSRIFGKEQAIMAGLEVSLGDVVVILDADLQEPLCQLAEMLQHRAQGYEVVYAVRAHRDDEPCLKRLYTRVFYTLLNFGTEACIPENARDCRLMDRCVVQIISIGVLGEYLARVFTEVKGRPGFIVAERHEQRARKQ